MSIDHLTPSLDTNDSHHEAISASPEVRHEIGRTASELYDLAISHELAARSLTGPARDSEEMKSLGYLLAARTREKEIAALRASLAAPHVTPPEDMSWLRDGNWD